jgi:hypothetical protein
MFRLPSLPITPFYNNNKDNGDVPMRETTEETKEKKQPAAHNSKKQSKDKTRVCTGERMSFTKWGTTKQQQTQQGTPGDTARNGLEPKVTTGEVTAATTTRT